MSSFLTRFVFLFILNSLWISAATVETFYGPLEVEEPVLLELIDSPCFQRLKNIHQYGVAYYTTHKEEYSRYDHSLGVFALLRLKGASLEEQIAGLLHDASHTVFSHVGDWIFEKTNQEKDYQNSIHEYFLNRYGLGEILNKYGFSSAQILPLQEYFPMLEKPSPALCADRIEYNIQGAVHQQFLSLDEALEIIFDLQYLDGEWISTNPTLMEKLGRFSLLMTETCWGGPYNHLTSAWLAEAILRAVEIDLISFEEIHIGEDDVLWNRLCLSDDIQIRDYMHKIRHADLYFKLTQDQTEADFIVKSKFRSIDPLIFTSDGIKKLSEIDPEYRDDVLKAKARNTQGWGVKLTYQTPCQDTPLSPAESR